MTKVIGILALQGAIEVHKKHIEALGAKALYVKREEDLDSIDALILPGGESSTMLKLINVFDMTDAIVKRLKEIPLLGICAGCILLAREVKQPEQFSFNMIDIEVTRNGYGTQQDSHEAQINGYDVTFIRAPIISKIGENVEILASHRDHPVWVKQGNVTVATFHPELNTQAPSPMHTQLFNLI